MLYLQRAEFGTCLSIAIIASRSVRVRNSSFWRSELIVLVQVHTDNHVQGGTTLTREVEVAVDATLGRFGDRITRVEVHLGDENSSSKAGDDDKRCVMEARLAGLSPITVTHHAASISEAIDGAAEKLEKTLTRTVDRLNDPKGRTSYSGV